MLYALFYDLSDERVTYLMGLNERVESCHRPATRCCSVPGGQGLCALYQNIL